MGKMTETDGKQYDLEKRTFEFAKRARMFVKMLPKSIANIEDGKQLVKVFGFGRGELH